MPAGTSYEVEACSCVAKEDAGRASDAVGGRLGIHLGFCSGSAVWVTNCRFLGQASTDLQIAGAS